MGAGWHLAPSPHFTPPIRGVLRQLGNNGDPDDPALAGLEQHLNADAWHSVVTGGGLPLVLSGLAGAIAAVRDASPAPLSLVAVATQIRLLASYGTEAVKYCCCRDKEVVGALVGLLSLTAAGTAWETSWRSC